MLCCVSLEFAFALAFYDLITFVGGHEEGETYVLEKESQQASNDAA